jgi:putative peptide zinc metalloprotease protein
MSLERAEDLPPALAAAAASAAASGPGLGASLVSSHWHRVHGLKPRLRETLKIHPQRWRGQLWYVVEDRLNGRFHRFDRHAMRVVRLLDGRHTLEALWQQLAREGGDDAPSQDDILSLLGQLHASDLLAADTLPDLAELTTRWRTQSRRKRMSYFINPLAIRIPLLDPDRFLQRLVALLRPVLNRWGALAWLALVLPALPLAVVHWQELTHNFTERMLALDNLVLLLLLFPVIKALHEIGHGIACRLRGGEVHDMGIMLLVFLPVPYVEASCSWSFQRKWDRALVGAAGMLVELAVAAVAFYLWLWLQPGVARALAYDVAILASITTLLFNGNPLLRYDGYYVLSDLIEIPNLSQRSNRWWGWLGQRWLLRKRDAASPAATAGEALWFALYAPLAFVYRMLVLFLIAVFVATQYLVVGVLIAVWGLIVSVGLPLGKGVRWLAMNVFDRLSPKRPKRVLTGLALALVAAVLWLPLPHRTQVEGVLSLPETGVLRAGQSGFVQARLAEPGTVLPPGAPVLRLHAPELQAEQAGQQARVLGAQVRLDAARSTDPAAAERLASEWRAQQAALDDLQARQQRLEVAVAAPGRLWQARAEDLDARWVTQGEVVAYVLPDAPPRLRVVVDQADATLIRHHTREVSVRTRFEPGRSWPATVLRSVPAASDQLPSAALGRSGGGGVATDPRDDSGRRALATHFELELALPPDYPHRVIGARASVRFEHEPEALAPRVARAVRRLFLAHFQT